jgi:hypothetical protein
MASDPLEQSPSRAPQPETSSAPLVGSRSQSFQRLQIGMFGLGSMILLVGLASIIMDNLRQSEAQVVVEAASNDAIPVIRPPVRDPLADAGVLPDLPARPERQAEVPAGAADNAPAP